MILHESNHSQDVPADLPILPGTRVRSDEGILGTVERLEPPDADEGSGYLAVRARNGEQHYRFPLRLVGAAGEEIEQSVMYTAVRVDVSPADLGRYLLEEQPARRTVEDAPVSQHMHEETNDSSLRIPLLQEQLVARIRPIELGTIRLHLGVETHEEVLTVPVTHEEVTIEHIPVDQYDASAPLDPNDTLIPIFEERLMVETRRVLTEYIRVRRHQVIQQQEVRGPVRRETFAVVEQPNGRVTLGGSDVDPAPDPA